MRHEPVAEVAVEARLAIRPSGNALSRLLPRGARALHAGSTRDADLLVVADLDEDAAGAVVETVTQHHGRRPEVLARSGTALALLTRLRDDSPFAALHRGGLAVLWPAPWEGGVESYRVVAPSRRRLDAAALDLRRSCDVRLDGLADVVPDALGLAVPLAPLFAHLTQRQLAAFRAAAAGGYYDIPRGSTADRLAASFGVSRTTFEEHLRKVESRAFPRLAQMLAAYPALLAGRKRVGRPPKRLSRSSGLSGAR